MMHKVVMRSSRLEDLSYVLEEESKAAAQGYVALWSIAEHQLALERELTYHMILEVNSFRIGYLIMNQDRHDNLELMRLVISEKQKGYGVQTLELVKQFAFGSLELNRLWLDVRMHNTRAMNIYDKNGFVEEGILRNSVKLEDHYVSIKIMSILRTEYEL